MSARFAIAEDVVHVDDPVSGAVLVLDLRAAMRGAAPLALGGAARDVWHALLAGEREGEVVRALAAREGVSEHEAADAVGALLESLLAQRCLVAVVDAHAG